MVDQSENWPDQRRWVSAISEVEDDEVLLRGYPHSQVIGNVTFAESFYLMVRGELPTAEQRAMMDALLCAVPDYGLFKPGTISSRIAVSANPSMTAGLAVAFLSAGKHTLDPFEAGTFVCELVERHDREGGDLDLFAKIVVAEMRAEKRRFPGFGHPVFEYVDPRSAALRKVAEKNGLISDALKIYEAVHRAFTADPRRATVPINDIGMSAAILAGMGFTPPEMTGIIVTSTLPGLVAHISEEMQQNVRIRVVDESVQRFNGRPRRELVGEGGVR